MPACRASSSIRTVDGRFDAYGQKACIQRGIINFQGAIDRIRYSTSSPVRKTCRSRPASKVTGTAQRPNVVWSRRPTCRIPSKLSGSYRSRARAAGRRRQRCPACCGTHDPWGQDGGVLRQLQRGLGIDEFGGAPEIGGYGNQPTSRVASSSGFSGSQTVSAKSSASANGSRPNALLSYEQSLNTSDSIVKRPSTSTADFPWSAAPSSERARLLLALPLRRCGTLAGG